MGVLEHNPRRPRDAVISGSHHDRPAAGPAIRTKDRESCFCRMPPAGVFVQRRSRGCSAERPGL